MTLLTKAHILKAAMTHKHLAGADFAWDEPGRCIISLRDGITWCARDDNRHVEGFTYSDASSDERDTLAHFRNRLRQIEAEV